MFMFSARDAFDEIKIKYDKVNLENCAIQHLSDLYLSDDSVSHLIDIKEINVSRLNFAENQFVNYETIYLY